VAERSPDGLARAIESVLRDPALGARLGAQARAMVEQRFGWAGVAERFESAYDRALAFTSPRR
jgi:glycogen(starch) synthase